MSLETSQPKTDGFHSEVFPSEEAIKFSDEFGIPIEGPNDIYFIKMGDAEISAHYETSEDEMEGECSECHEEKTLHVRKISIKSIENSNTYEDISLESPLGHQIKDYLENYFYEQHPPKCYDCPDDDYK